MLEPVLLEQVRVCHFKAKPCKDCGRPKSAHGKPFEDDECTGWRAQRGCFRCGRNKSDRAHFGTPPSYNAVGTGRGTSTAALVGAGIKQAWEDLLLDLLRETALPKLLGSVFVEGEMTFASHQRRDQGNFRVIIEKSLGDALVRGGWLADDDWTRYSFGDLQQRYHPSENATRLTIFPKLETREPVVDQQQMEVP